MPDAKKLARIHRVRTIQLGLTRAEEARVNDKAASEAALSARITALADAVAPAPDAGGAFSFIAAAHFRDRLNQSAVAARDRLAAAERFVERAADATRAAHRDQSAVEKLMARADAEAALKAIRALEAAPVTRTIRHDPC